MSEEDMTQYASDRHEQQQQQSYTTRYIIHRDDLFDGANHLFRGAEHGGVPMSFFWGVYSSGQGPKLHKHPYEEVHIVEEGRAFFTLYDREMLIDKDHVVIVPRDAPHKFVVNTSEDEPLRMISIHCSGKLITEYL